eukprot:scaffold9046_cov60-Attheya_sp.AAC.6
MVEFMASDVIAVSKKSDHCCGYGLAVAYRNNGQPKRYGILKPIMRCSIAYRYLVPAVQD